MKRKTFNDGVIFSAVIDYIWIFNYYSQIIDTRRIARVLFRG